MNHVDREFQMLKVSQWAREYHASRVNHLLRYSKKMNELKNTTVTDRQSEPRLKIVSKKMSESASMDSDIGYK